LAAAHDAKVLHGDIKPSNVLIRESDQLVKVCDFGAGLTLSTRERLAAGDVLGTVRYASPEIRKGHSPSIHSDLYSVAVVLYECSIGSRRFNDVAHRIASGERTAETNLSSHNPSFPATVAEVIMQAMSVDPQRRPRNASEFSTLLQRALQDHQRRSREETRVMDGGMTETWSVQTPGSKPGSRWLRIFKDVVMGDTDVASPSAPASAPLEDALLDFYKRHRTHDGRTQMYLPRDLVLEVPKGSGDLAQWNVIVREADYRACKVIGADLERQYEGRVSLGVGALSVVLVHSSNATSHRILEERVIDPASAQFEIPSSFRRAPALLKMTFRLPRPGSDGVGLYPLTGRFTLGRGPGVDAVYRSPVDVWALDKCALIVQEVSSEGINCLAQQEKGMTVWKRRSDTGFRRESVSKGEAILVVSGDELQFVGVEPGELRVEFI
jgi:hypothetical protein